MVRMLLIAAALLLAQEGLPSVPERMPVDDAPSAAACTFVAALRGETCTYEASPAAGDPRDNAGSALEAGRDACSHAAHGDLGLRKECEAAVAEASASEKCAIRWRLTDLQGHLTPQARACAEALREEISRTARAATMYPDCCACLARSRCSVGAAQCKRELADLSPGPELRSCLERSCRDTCPSTAPAHTNHEEPQPTTIPEDPKRPRKI